MQVEHRQPAAPPVYIVSGGMGTSAEHVIRAAMVQFKDAHVPIVIVPHVREREQLEQAVQEAAARGGMIVHTLVDERLRTPLRGLARDYGVVEIDLMGPLLERLADVLQQAPLNWPGLYRELHADYFDRVEAIEYTVAHDDGCKPGEWRRADIVLTGVSRVGKTPTSMYLAVLGWKVANVPLVPTVEPPRELMQLDRQRVIGLTIQPEKLEAHRRGRQQRLNISLGSSYTSLESLYEEVEAARRVCRRGGFRIVDTTDKPIEHIADEVVRLVKPR